MPYTPIRRGAGALFDRRLDEMLRELYGVLGNTSTDNTTSTPLGSGATFTGTLEQNDYPDVLVSCQTDNPGRLYFDFSVDGTNVATYPIEGYEVAAGIHTFHTEVKGPRYFRVRLVNETGAQSYLRLYTYFGTFSSDAGITKPIVTDHYALQVTPPPEGKTAFGEAVVAQPTPVIQITFPYKVNPGLVDIRENQSGTVTHVNRSALMSTGAAANSSAEIRSKRIMKYNPGQGSMVRFTAVFSTPAANSVQLAGIGNESDGLFFGYNGTSFGIMHRKNGKPEVRTLTITTASSTAENITITLDGDTASVAVTNTGNTTLTANEIAAHDYSDTGRGWSAYAVGATVVFKSWDAATHSGTFSLSGATTAVGSFAQNVVGTAPTESWTAQASWNGVDKFDGNGLTGTTINPATGNVYQIKYQWLGYGLLSFYMEDPDDGELHLVHAIEYANANTSPSLGDPSLSLIASAENTSNTTNITVSVGSMAAFIEGKTEFIGVRRGKRNTKTTVTTTLLPILSVRQGLHFNSQATQTFAKVMRLAVSAEHTKPILIAIIEDATLTGASWQDFDSTSTSMQWDTSATAVSGGNETFALPLGKGGNDVISFVDDYFAYNLPPGKTLTFAAITSSGTGGEATVAVRMLERL